ncbi:MAG: DUF4846 domain-containing protein [Bacteroidota bacterium]
MKLVLTKWMFLFFAFGCADSDSQNKSYLTSNPEEDLVLEAKSIDKKEQEIPIDSSEGYVYSWKETYDYKAALINRMVVPVGFERVKLEKGSFGDWLRHLPLEPGKGTVNYFNGDPKFTQKIHAGVIDMDVGTRDLQQCADAIMRVKAEYHYQRKEYSDIHFNFTSGDKVSFDDWRKGKKPRISGNNVTFTGFSGNVDNSYRNFKKYLISIFSYAGTASLERELSNIELIDMQPGDMFIQGGSPGHAVLVMDMAINKSTDEKLFLLAQSYMPAQDFHILRNLNDKKLDPWYRLDFGNELSTPEWRFDSNDLYRF